MPDRFVVVIGGPGQFFLVDLEHENRETVSGAVNSFEPTAARTVARFYVRSLAKTAARALNLACASVVADDLDHAMDGAPA